MQDALHLDANQIKMAKGIWRQVCQELGGIQAERRAILLSVQQQDSQPLAWLADAPEKTAAALQLLEQVSKLKENAFLQSKILRHACRLFVWQICSPENLALVFWDSWPAFPNLFGLLKTVAAMPAP